MFKEIPSSKKAQSASSLSLLATPSKTTMFKVAIIGGGVGGATAALGLLALNNGQASLPISVTLFESGTQLVDGPPMCHLHAGGALYPKLSAKECIQLLKDSIAFARVYQPAINPRPTVICFPRDYSVTSVSLLPRFEKIRAAYTSLVQEDPDNKVLGPPSKYYQLFFKEDLVRLANKKPLQQHDKEINTWDESWLVPFARSTDLDSIQYPVVLVQEYGISGPRVAAQATHQLRKYPSTRCSLRLSTTVTNVVHEDSPVGRPWKISYSNGTDRTEHFDYLIISAGYQTYNLEKGIPRTVTKHRTFLAEFKAAYLLRLQLDKDGQPVRGLKESAADALWPEVIFHGDRGTPSGMAQLTPYNDGVFQLHGMTKDITLFEGGLVKMTDHDQVTLQTEDPAPIPGLSVLKYFPSEIQETQNTNIWRAQTKNSRTIAAMRHLGKFLIPFRDVTPMVHKPMWGIQQVPGESTELRAATIFTGGDSPYTRLQIVKASSAVTAAKQIAAHVAQFLPASSLVAKDDVSQNLCSGAQLASVDSMFGMDSLKQHDIEKLDDLGRRMAISRGYPSELSSVYPKPQHAPIHSKL